jgi:LAO/AO transport system kinase
LSASSEIAQRLLSGERAALARLISWAENAHPGFPEALSTIYPRVGRSWRIGITGPPGVGKSALTNRIVQAIRARDETVGILAIDPSSPFTGGALLGDRIRMEERTSDPGVFIRSMASRDSRGGLARAAVDACDVMDAYGFDYIIIETVGAGQTEYDVVSAADTVLVVLCPGAGDGIQAMKAGILEVADLLVVNKADLDGADQLVLYLEDALKMRELHRSDTGEWAVPVVPASAAPGAGAQLESDGIGELLAQIGAHRKAQEGAELDQLRGAKRVRQVRRVVRERLEEELWGQNGYTDRVVSSLGSSATPYDVAQEILSAVLGRSQARATASDLPDQGTSSRSRT